MKLLFKTLVATSILASAALLPAHADSFSDAQKGEIEGLIRSYLLDHPEILREMAQKLEVKEKQAEDEKRGQSLVENKAEIFQKASDPVVGNPKGNVVIVEFMDYNCGWCKKAVGEMVGLIESDKDVKIVIKDFPIFGEGSEYAAKAAVAASKQGKYWELHNALFAHEGQINKEVVDQAANGLGIDVKKMQEDIESKEVGDQIAANIQLAKDMAINGTPAFIVDDKVYGGYLPLNDLMAAIAEVRANGCKMC
jgi:protein-disulfide isomerase